MSAGDPPSGQVSPARYVLDNMGLRLYDGSSTDYGAPSGVGVTMELRNDGTMFLGKGLTIQSAILGAFLKIDFTTANPMIRISDGSSDRVQIGNLIANGISPAQWGMRVNDAVGSPIFDSLGLINVMTLLGSGANNNNAFTITSTTFVPITGCSVSFTIPRTTKFYLAWASSAVVTAAGAGFYGYVAPVLDSVAQNFFWGLWDKTNLGYTNATGVAQFTLAAGAHTIELQGKVDATCTWTNFNTYIYVFQLGA